MTTLFYVAQFLVCVAVIADMYRRPESAWTSADRERGFWASIFGVLGLFGIGLIAAVIYVVFLVPRLSDASPGGGDVSDGFRKPPAR